MSKNIPDIQRVIDFQAFLLQFRSVERVIHQKHKDAQVHENDVEHSYSLAMIAWFLAGNFPELDKNRLIQYALVHDLVEVYAGDTYIFADKALLESKQQREQEALEKIAAEWTDFPDMTLTIEKYETMSDPEAKFIYALDKITPIMMNVINNGYTWQNEAIDLEQLHANKVGKVSRSPEIESYYKQLYDFLKANQHLFTGEYPT